VTKKGKGCLFAEKDPVRFHGISHFDINTGEVMIKKSRLSVKSYTEVFRDKIVQLAGADKRIMAITAAMPEGTGLDKFRDSFADRFFDCGIAESHAVCFAAGLAKQGFKPVVAIYSTFLQRAYDQIIQDVALQELPVIFAIDRAGIVGEDGVTHQGIFDIAYLRSIPNLVVMAPGDGAELEQMLEFALQLDKPVAIRYPRAEVPLEAGLASPLKLGQGQLIKEGKNFTIIALGSMVSQARKALELLNSEGLSGSLINARFVAPLDMELIKRTCGITKFIFTVEEGIKDAGFGSAIAQQLDKPVGRLGLPFEFVPHGARGLLLEKYKLDAKGIAAHIRQAIKKNG
jgi:1-deoxy-D-xylulose-5-phosphate synthase